MWSNKGKYFSLGKARWLCVAFLFFLLVIISLVSIQCGGGGGGGSSEPSESFESVVDTQGGIVEVTDPSSMLYGVRINVPEGAVNEVTTIRLEYVADPPASELGSTQVGLAIDLGPEGLKFATPIQLTLPYSATDLAGTGCSLENLGVYYYDTDVDGWLSIPIEALDIDNQRVTVTIDHFTLIQTCATEETSLAADSRKAVWLSYRWTYPNVWDDPEAEGEDRNDLIALLSNLSNAGVNAIYLNIGSFCEAGSSFGGEFKDASITREYIDYVEHVRNFVQETKNINEKIKVYGWMNGITVEWEGEGEEKGDLKLDEEIHLENMLQTIKNVWGQTVVEGEDGLEGIHLDIEPIDGKYVEGDASKPNNFLWLLAQLGDVSISVAVNKLNTFLDWSLLHVGSPWWWEAEHYKSIEQFVEEVVVMAYDYGTEIEAEKCCEGSSYTSHSYEQTVRETVNRLAFWFPEKIVIGLSTREFNDLHSEYETVTAGSQGIKRAMHANKLKGAALYQLQSFKGEDPNPVSQQVVTEVELNSFDSIFENPFPSYRTEADTDLDWVINGNDQYPNDNTRWWPCHEADTDCDYCIEITELMAYIAKWKAGEEVTMTELMEAIGLWKQGCEGTVGRAIADYFPMNPGNEWIYYETDQDGPEWVKQVVFNQESHFGIDVIPFGILYSQEVSKSCADATYDPPEETDFTYYTFDLQEGLLVHGVKIINEEDMVSDYYGLEPPIQVFRAFVALGDPQLVNSATRTDGLGDPISATYEIVAFNDVIEVPAGIFNDTIKVRSVVNGHVKNEWYARWVGLVKVEAVDNSDEGLPGFGNMVLHYTNIDVPE